MGLINFKLKIKKLRKTSGAYPSQWEGELDSGEIFYARYEGGQLHYGVGADLNDAVTGCWRNEPIKVYTGTEGMSSNQIIRLLELVVKKLEDPQPDDGDGW